MPNQTPDDRFGKHYNKFWNKQMKDPEFKKEYDKLSADDRFDERFPPFKGVGAPFPIFKENPNREHIKSFLHSEIDLARKEGIEEGKNIVHGDMRRKFYQKGYDEGLGDEKAIRADALEQAAKAVESIIFDNEGNTKNGTAPSILINPRKYADLQTWNYVLTSAADIIRKLKNK